MDPCFQRSTQYIPRNMHTFFALLCFVVVIHWLIFPYPSGIGWIIFSHSYLHVTHDKISVCLAIWLIWWTNIFVIKMINTPGHVLSPGWPLYKRSGLTLIEVSQHAYSSYQASSLPFIFYHVILATWCNWFDFYWCWIKSCLSLSLSLVGILLPFIYMCWILRPFQCYIAFAP